MSNKGIDELMKQANVCLYAVDGCSGLKGTTDWLLLSFAMITCTMLEDKSVNKKVLREVLELGFEMDENSGLEKLLKIQEILLNYGEEK